MAQQVVLRKLAITALRLPGPAIHTERNQCMRLAIVSTVTFAAASNYACSWLLKNLSVRYYNCVNLSLLKEQRSSLSRSPFTLRIWNDCDACSFIAAVQFLWFIDSVRAYFQHSRKRKPSKDLIENELRRVFAIADSCEIYLDIRRLRQAVGMDFKGGAFVGNALMAVMNGLPEHLLNKFVWTVEAATCKQCGEADIRVYPFVFLKLEDVGFMPNSIAQRIRAFEKVKTTQALYCTRCKKWNRCELRQFRNFKNRRHIIAICVGIPKYDRWDEILWDFEAEDYTIQGAPCELNATVQFIVRKPHNHVFVIGHDRLTGHFIKLDGPVLNMYDELDRSEFQGAIVFAFTRTDQ